MINVRRVAIQVALFALDRVPRHHLVWFLGVAQKRYNSAAGQSLSGPIDIAIAHSSDVAATINALTDVAKPEPIIVAIQRLVGIRHEVIDALFQSRDKITNASVAAVVDLWRAENNGSLLSEQTLDEYLLAARTFDPQVQRTVELLILLGHLKAERLEAAKRLIATSRTCPFQNLPPPHQMGLLRCALKAGSSEYAELRTAVDGGMSALDRLKVLELDIAAGIQQPVKHADLVDRFLRAAPASFAEEFRRIIKPFYDQHDMQYMDARVRPEVAERLREFIRDRIASAAPLSMIRGGDGEAYAYANDAVFVSVDDAEVRERHWWGCQLQQSERAELQSRIRFAIESADIIGVPSVYRFIRDCHFATNSMASTVSMRGLATIVARIRPKAGALIAEDRIHQVLFTRDSLLSISKLTKGRVIAVSSLREDKLSEVFPGALSIPIPTHYKLQTNDIFLSNDVPLPHVYDEVVETIRKTVGPGDLVLVAGGIIGKIFVHEACARGAVALDVGSMFDYAAGAKTRSVSDVI